MVSINYKAHIPAGIAFAGGLSMIAGWPAVVPVLIGGAFGGALPDIDIEGSAIENMGDKTAGAVDKAVGKRGDFGKRLSKMSSAIGKSIDMIFLTPIGKIWRFLSKKVFGNIYLKLYHLGKFGQDGKCLGEVLHWNGDAKPWAHRGGITHSFSFMITSCIVTVPIAFVFQSPEFLIGCEAGIMSHLVADSFCKSGVKFFFPFQPKIGFNNDSDAGRGRDIRLLPKGMQVSTGKDRITNTELDNYPDQEKAMRDRKLRFREKMWQWIFKILALLIFIALCIGLVGPGGIVMNAMGQDFSGQTSPVAAVTNTSDDSGKAQDVQNSSFANTESSAAMSVTTETISSDSNANIPGTGNAQASSANGLDLARAGSDLSGADPIRLEGSSPNSKPEIKGVTSLTKGDIDVKDLPRGVVKMPDESLWIIGVGPVTRENLNNPMWQFTEDEKIKLMAAAGAQRLNDIPTSVSNIFTDAGKVVTDTAQDVKDAAATTGQNAQDAAESGVGGIAGLFKDLTGIDITGGSSGGGYKGGFLGITTWTDT